MSTSEQHHPLLRNAHEIRQFIAKLLKLWDRDGEKDFSMKSEFARGNGPMIWSLTNHTVELARTVVDLSAHDRMLVAMPLIRLSIENAMTAVWLLVSPDSAGALMHEGLRQRRAAIEQVVKLGATGFDESSLAAAAAELEEFSGMKSDQGQQLQKRFEAIQGGANIYVSYRIASSLSHAGVILADAYLEETPITADAPLGIALAPDRRLDADESWLGTEASMLLTAMTACDRIDGRGGKKNQLADAARKLGVSMDFELSTATV